ncbi:decarboxylase [Streptomyces sp. PRh5]|uniref:acetolactate synthase large subunit n=1 Tax=Streptomyces sp. PRh5 TaxID=1158056 RepID=UPI000451D3D0|nr:acetolactate synthase large subunit [Streptomyces sp. PRh5]EXU66222.1 decarboxylase [Streptomyces sp. PRh5]
MKGAEAIIKTMIDSDVRVCFGNPGTSEMHFVAALDRYPEMRGILCLFEGVATGAADGYGRMTRRPAATLLHLGPGLGNGLANLHNARRAGTPVLNVVGEHSRDHKPLDSPLDSDIDAVAGSVSAWLYRPTDGADLGRDVAAAIAATRGLDDSAAYRTGTSGSIATVVVPADLSWSTGGVAAPSLLNRPAREAVVVSDAAEKVLRSGEKTALLLDGQALTEEGLNAADRIAQATGALLFCPTWPAALRRGAGVPAVTPLAYRSEDVQAQMTGVRHLVLAGARRPVASFGYPGKNGDLVPAGIDVHLLADEFTPVLPDLTGIADQIAPDLKPRPAPAIRTALPRGVLTRDNWAWVIGGLLPQDAIVCDESITAGMQTLAAATAGAPPHDVLGLVGLAIGQGLPLSVGAAVACPDRPVVCLEADGSAMYTISALWTQARENLDITTVVLNNKSYAILRSELDRVGAQGEGGASTRMLDLSRPDLDFVALSHGMGVPATRATTAEELADQFAAATRKPGPHLIEAVLS